MKVIPISQETLVRLSEIVQRHGISEARTWCLKRFFDISPAFANREQHNAVKALIYGAAYGMQNAALLEETSIKIVDLDMADAEVRAVAETFLSDSTENGLPPA